MKSNLKNRPKSRLTRDWGNDPEGKCEYWVNPPYIEWVTWFEGFEKELREQLPTDEEYKEAHPLMFHDVIAVYDLIKEILGE